MTRLAAVAAILMAAMSSLLLPLPAGAMTIERVSAASGVEAWLVEDHSAPIVTLRFAFDGGAALDPAGKEGTASLVAALLDEGAGPLDSNAFHRRLEDLAGELAFGAGKDEFAGTLRMLRRNLSETTELLRLSLSDPHFEPDAVERIRGEALAAVAQQARNPRSQAAHLWMRDAFEDHPYGRDAIGTAKSVAAITRDDLVAFAGARLHRRGLVIGAVGDITPAELTVVLDKVFGGLPQGGDLASLADAKPVDAGALLVEHAAVPQSAVTFGQAGPKRGDPDWYAAYVLNDIIGGGGFRGRLMQEIREKRGLAYGVSTELVPYRHAGLILGSVATENSRVAESIALIRTEWQRLRDAGPSESELQDAKDYLIGSFPLSLDSTRRIAATLVQLQIDKLGIDYLDRRAALIGGVTLQQARDVARRLYDPARLSFAVVGNPAGLEPTRTAPADKAAAQH